MPVQNVSHKVQSATLEPGADAPWPSTWWWWLSWIAPTSASKPKTCVRYLHKTQVGGGVSEKAGWPSRPYRGR